MFGLPRAFWLLFIGTLINRIGGFVIPFLSLYLTNQRGISISQAGLIVSLFGAGHYCRSFTGRTARVVSRCLWFNMGLSFFIGPILGGWMLETFGAGTLWGGCFILGLFLSAAYLLLGRFAGKPNLQEQTS